MKFKYPVTTTSNRKFVARNDLSVADLNRTSDKEALIVTVPEGETVDGFIADLKSDTTVEYAERNSIRQLVSYDVPPNDPGFTNVSESWWLRDAGDARRMEGYLPPPAAARLATLDRGLARPRRGWDCPRHLVWYAWYELYVVRESAGTYS